MSVDQTLINRFVLGCDVAKYSGRNTRRQADIQRDLELLAGNAAQLAGLGLDRDVGAWDKQPTGDGFLLVLPPDADGVRLVNRFPRELNTLLEIRNGDRVPEAQIRLRLAIHHDALLPSDAWYAGPALIEIARLLDATPLRHALDSAAPAHLALIVSEQVFRSVVRSGLDGLTEDDFAQVVVDHPAKDYRSVAYVHVPGKKAEAMSKALKAAVEEDQRQPSPGVANDVRVKGDHNTIQTAGGSIYHVEGLGRAR